MKIDRRDYVTMLKCNREKKVKNEIVRPPYSDGWLCIVLRNQKKEFTGLAWIDSDDLPKVQSHRWYLSKIGYAVTGREIVSLASFILGVKTDRNTVIDHKNQNKLDNRKCNLRVVDKSINALNAKIRNDNTSGHCGVSFDKARNRWTARISIHGKVSCIGRYATIEEAVDARELAEKREKEKLK